MNITGPLIALIANNVTAAALTSGRVYPVVAPQGAEVPHVVMRIIEVQPSVNKQTTSSVDGIVVRLSTLAKDYHFVQRTDEAIRRAIDGYRGNVTLSGTLIAIDGVNYLTGEDLFEDAPELFRRDAIYKVRLIRTGDPISSGGGAGAATDFTLIEVPAGENLSTGRVIIVDAGLAYYFQPGTPAHAGRAVGVTKTSALAGVSVTVQISGRVTDAGIVAIADQPCFVGANGQILTTYPASGNVQKCGVGTAANTMQIDFAIQIVAI